VVLLLGIAYFKFQNITVVQSALGGMAAVAVGMTLGMGVKMSLRYPFSWWSIAIMAASFLTIGVFRWPLLYVGAVLIPLSVGLAWRSAAKPPGRDGAAGGAEEKEKPPQH